MQTHDIVASLHFLRDDLRYSPTKVAEALKKGCPMLLRGAESFALELADALGGLTPIEACFHLRTPLSALLAL